MTTVDAGLIYEARQLSTGASVHRIDGMILMYRGEAAGNDPASQRTARMFRRELAAYVRKLRNERARSQRR